MGESHVCVLYLTYYHVHKDELGCHRVHVLGSLQRTDMHMLQECALKAQRTMRLKGRIERTFQSMKPSLLILNPVRGFYLIKEPYISTLVAPLAKVIVYSVSLFKSCWYF